MRTEFRSIEIPMDFDSLAAAGSMAGSGGVIVLDDSRDMVWALNNINEFYAHESCGQCTPCREGSLWMKKITDRMLLRRRRRAGSRHFEDRGRQHRRPHHLRFRRSLRLADAKLSSKNSATNSPQRAQKPVPPPMPPEYTSEELIAEPEIATVPLAHDPGWEKAGAAGNDLNV